MTDNFQCSAQAICWSFALKISNATCVRLLLATSTVESVFKALQTDRDVLETCSEALRSNRELVLFAISQSSGALLHTSDKLLNDRNFCLEAIDINPLSFLFFDPDDKELALVRSSLPAL